MPNDDLITAAGDAALVKQVRGFLSWLGEGRKLTQAGRIGLGDAAPDRTARHRRHDGPEDRRPGPQD